MAAFVPSPVSNRIPVFNPGWHSEEATVEASQRQSSVETVEL